MKGIFVCSEALQHSVEASMCKDGASISRPHHLGSRPSGRTWETPASLHRIRTLDSGLGCIWVWDLWFKVSALGQ